MQGACQQQQQTRQRVFANFEITDVTDKGMHIVATVRKNSRFTNIYQHEPRAVN